MSFIVPMSSMAVLGASAPSVISLQWLCVLEDQSTRRRRGAEASQGWSVRAVGRWQMQGGQTRSSAVLLD